MNFNKPVTELFLNNYFLYKSNFRPIVACILCNFQYKSNDASEELVNINNSNDDPLQLNWSW